MTTASDKFLADGFVAVRRAVAPGVVRTCVALIEDELRTRGIEDVVARLYTRQATP